MGQNSLTAANFAFAFGFNAKSYGLNSFSFGDNVNANGNFSVAFGDGVISSSDYSYTFGHSLTTDATNSFTFGYNSINSGVNSFSLGQEININSGTNNVFIIGKGILGNRLNNNTLSNSFFIGFNTNSPTFSVLGDYNGKVGINTGTVVPDAQFEVKGPINDNDKIVKFISNNNEQFLFVPKAGTNNPYNALIQPNDICLIYTNAHYGMPRPNDNTTGFSLAPFNTEEGKTLGLRINSEGDFGINTPTINATLQVNGDAAIGYTDALPISGGLYNGLLVNGSVGINLYPNIVLAADAKLSVNGAIYATKIVVQNPNWADYVFTNNYHLMSIDSLELYINTFKHLPKVPTENEICSTGVDLQKTNELLLSKIEEITLYLIQQNKQIQILENKLGQLESHEIKEEDKKL